MEGGMNLYEVEIIIDKKMGERSWLLMIYIFINNYLKFWVKLKINTNSAFYFLILYNDLRIIYRKFTNWGRIDKLTRLIIWWPILQLEEKEEYSQIQEKKRKIITKSSI